MSIQALLKDKGRFVPIISSNVTIHDVIDKLEIDKAGALVVTDDLKAVKCREMLEYCELDTKAMWGIWARLRDEVAQPLDQHPAAAPPCSRRSSTI